MAASVQLAASTHGDDMGIEGNAKELETTMKEIFKRSVGAHIDQPALEELRIKLILLLGRVTKFKILTHQTKSQAPFRLMKIAGEFFLEHLSTVEKALKIRPLITIKKETAQIAQSILQGHSMKCGETLGSGTYGTVYEATIERKRYAIKVFEYKDEGEYEAVLHIAAHSSRAILPVFYAGQYEEDYVLIMPLAKRSLDESDLKETYSFYYVLLQNMLLACDALSHCKITHNDLRKHNILQVCERSGASSFMISDFSIAFHDGKNETGTEALLKYRAPEKDDLKRADLWSLGVTMFELLTGVHPFSKRSIETGALLWQSSVNTRIEYILAQREVKTCLEKRDPEGKLINFIRENLLQIDPKKRFDPSKTSQHPLFKQPDPTIIIEEEAPSEAPAAAASAAASSAAACGAASSATADAPSCEISPYSPSSELSVAV